MTEATWRHKANPWEPADYGDDGAVIYAVRALKAGTANPGQQHLLWAWIMHASGEDDWPFRPEAHGGQRGTDVALGKQLVAKQMKKMLSPLMTPKTAEEPPMRGTSPRPTKRTPPRRRR